jgi:hypothetical protein
MDPRKVPALNTRLGYVRTPVGTVRVEPEGVALFATRGQLDAYAEGSGVIVDAEAVLVELDNAGRLLFQLPDAQEVDAAVQSWIDELLTRAKEAEVEETFFRGYTAGLKAVGAQPDAARPAPPPAPRTKRAPAPGSMREAVRSVLEAAAEDWLTATEVTERAPAVIGRHLARRSVYNALMKEVKRGGVRRWESGGVVRFRLA